MSKKSVLVQIAEVVYVVDSELIKVKCSNMEEVVDVISIIAIAKTTITVRYVNII